MNSAKKLTAGLNITMIAILGLSALTGCGGGSATSPPEPEPVGDELPEGVFYWGFDEGPPPDWEISPDWRIEEGALTTESPGQLLFSAETWENFTLYSRVRITEGSAFGIFFRVGEPGAFQFSIEPGAVVFVSDLDGPPEERPLPGFHLEPGWHEVQLLVEGAVASLRVDGETVMEVEDLQNLSPGSIGVFNHAPESLAIDFIEIHSMGGGGEVLVGQPEPSPGGAFEEFPDVVVETPPIAGLIQVSNPDAQFSVTVSGAPGAVEPGSLVSVANLDTTRVYFADADQDGSFELELFAHPGSALQIKHATFGFYNEQERDETLAVGKPIEVILEWMNATTGTIMRVPDAVQETANGIPFSVNGFLFAGQAPYWHAEGVIEILDPSPQGMRIKVEGTLTLTAEGLASAVDVNDLNAALLVSLVRHFGADGNQTVIRKYMISDFLTPTGFPIYHGEIVWSPFTRWVPLDRWQQVSENSVETQFEFEMQNEDHLQFEGGYYGLQIEMAPPEGMPMMQNDGPTMRAGMLYANGGFYGPLFQLGSAEPPRLHWGLLTDTLHEATRGATAHEDIDHMGLISMISFQDDKFILPREDAETGEPISYRLEPFLPLIAYGDRGLPNPPSIDFAFPSGELEVVVRRPDGGVDRFGPSPFLQSTNATPSYPYGKVRDYSNGGGAMQEVYQLTTLDEAFDYRFEQYGHYQIEMRGQVDDVRGNTYLGGGTYDVYVARPLKLYAGMLPTTPFVQGDAFSPSLQVYPRMPVEVEMTLTFLPDSSTERAVTRRYTGQANEYGYFYPGDVEPFTFEDGGEYRLDIHAQYTDPDGTTWMGSATWGNVVENAGTRIIAHGRRGLDSPDANSIWFFHNNLGLEGIFHTFFPYYSGDVFWGFHDPRPDAQAQGADAINPGISLEDRSGEIYAILQRNWSRAHAAIPVESMQAAIADGEVIPFSTTRSGMGLEWFPEQVDQHGYTYASSERPGARVHESIGEGGIPVSYWRYDGTYGDQVGVEGDLPNDLKWQFGGVVFRDQASGMNDYGAYASLWVLIPDEDPMGARVTPPFQGATGGPNGGPILTLHGEDIDLFFYPRSGFPGQVLVVGETLSFAGHVGPPLDSQVSIQITSPSGEVTNIEGQANKVGYFYQPESDIVVDQPGVWQVAIEVLHDGMTSSGPTTQPYPTGGVLGAQGREYEIFVVERAPSRAEVTAPVEGFLQISGSPINPIPIRLSLPAGFDGARYTYTIAMPGFILEQGDGVAQGTTLELEYDPASLHEEYLNLDITAYDYPRPGLADQVWISILLEAGGQTLPVTITLHGEEVFHR